MFAQSARLTFKRVPWRIFRQDAAAKTRIPAWCFVLAYAASLLASHLCQIYFGAVVIWTANGVLVAAMLLLDRRSAMIVFALCVALNLALELFVRKNGFDSALVFPLLNALEVIAVTILARRFCGGALRLSRPIRMARFALLAAAPSVCLAAAIGLSTMDLDPIYFWPYFGSWVSAELLPILVIATCTVMLAQKSQQTEQLQAGTKEAAWLIGLGCAFTFLACVEVSLPMASIFPVLLLVALRLTSRQAALLVLMVSALTTGIFLFGHPSFASFDIGSPAHDLANVSHYTLDMPAFYTFLAIAVSVIFSVSTVVNEKSRLQVRLQGRTAQVRQDAAQLAQAKKLAEQAAEAKRRFLNMVSHELRTPLGQVAGFTGLVAADEGLAQDSRDMVGKISMANAHALMLVEDMIDFARLDFLVVPEPINLREVVGSVVDHVRTNVARGPLDVVFENHLGEDVYFVADEKRIRQLLRLLMHNAVKFTRQGRIGISAEPTAQGARLVVFDTGCGFDTSLLESMQEAFSQADSSSVRPNEGAGLGLALAGRILAATNGRWSFDSHIGQGTRVTLDLQMERAAAPESTTEGPDRPPRVLVVDDHPANREILGLLLRAMGCDTDYASDGIEAVDMARQSLPDIIFMDLRMPRMDGYEASRQIRALPGDISRVPILAVSAECREEALAACHACGIDAFLSKPVNQTTLYETVVRWLDPDQARTEGDTALAG
jgi:Signal transduction histidine kinase